MFAGPKPQSFGFSALLHASVLCWVAFSPRPEPKPKTLYQQYIEPNKDKIVWYRFKDKLPDVSPIERKGISQPPRAEVKTAKQTIVSKSARAKPAPQMVWTPAPKLELEADLKSPNLLSFKAPLLPPPNKAKLFAPPPEELKRILPPPALPDVPAVETATQGKPAPIVADGIEQALANKPAPKPFVPPQTAPKPAPAAPALPEAPKVEVASAANTAVPPDARLEAALRSKPKPKEFVPPAPKQRAAAPQPAIPAAPNVAIATNTAQRPGVDDGIASALAAKPKPKAFVAPLRTARTPGAAPAIPAAPRLAAAANVRGGSVPDGRIESALAAKPKPRAFVAPSARAPGTGGRNVGSIAAPPPVNTASKGTGDSAPGALGDGGIQAALAARRSLVMPDGKRSALGPTSEIQDAPELTASATVGPINAAIVGLTPAERLEVPVPQGNRAAQFSAAPEINTKGGDGEPVAGARIFVPDLMISGGSKSAAKDTTARPVLMARAAPTSREALQAAMRGAPAVPAPPSEPVLSAVTKVVAAPDPRLDGKTVYTMAIQMPNVTSYMGSWMMWYAERQPYPGEAPDMEPPIPLRKVDPKYFPSAIADRVEGKVQYSCVIRTDGRIDLLRILKNLDERLDRSAAEALLKWEFKPAKRNGVPVEVDVVFEIPFRLAPKIPGR